MLKYVQGNLFDLLPYDTEMPKFIPHIVNNIGAFGGGFTKYLKVWPEVEKIYRSQPFYTLGQNHYVKVAEDKSGGPIWVCNMVAQNGTINANNPKPIKYLALAECMAGIRTQIVEQLIAIGHLAVRAEIFCPMFGSGLAGGNWDFIEELINEIWQDLDVTVYRLD